MEYKIGNRTTFQRASKTKANELIKLEVANNEAQLIAAMDSMCIDEDADSEDYIPSEGEKSNEDNEDNEDNESDEGDDTEQDNEKDAKNV